MGFVTKGNRLADIGTDHGFIPIALVKNGICPKAIAVDINAGPITVAREHVKEAELSDLIECKLGDGLSVVNPDDVDTIIIAGMGGDLISNILENANEGFRGSKELVLSPQSEPEKVRRTLHKLGYMIKAEKYFMDEGKKYNIIYAVPGSEEYCLDEEYRYGKLLLMESNELLEETIRMQMVVFMSARNRIVTNNAYMKDVETEIVKKNKETQAALQKQIDGIKKILKQYY